MPLCFTCKVKKTASRRKSPSAVWKQSETYSNLYVTVDLTGTLTKDKPNQA